MKRIKRVAVTATILLLLLTCTACSKTEANETRPSDIPDEAPSFEEAFSDMPESKEDFEPITERALMFSEYPEGTEILGKYYAIEIDSAQFQTETEDGGDFVEIADVTPVYCKEGESSEAFTAEINKLDHATV